MTATAKATALVGLKLNEISLVDNPANAKARVLLVKRGEAKKADPSSTDVHVPAAGWAARVVPAADGSAAQKCRKCETAVDASDQFCKGCGVPFNKQLAKVRTRARLKLAGALRTKGSGDPVKKLAAALKGYADGEAMTTAEAVEDQEERELLSALWSALDSIFEDDTLSEDQQRLMVGQSFDEFMSALTANDATATGKRKEKSMKVDLSKAAPEIKAHVEKLEADLAAEKTARAEAEKKAAPAEDADVTKGMTPEAAVEFKKLQTESAAATAEIKKLRDEQSERESIEKAKTEYGALPGSDAVALGKLLKRLREKAADETKELETLMKSWNGTIAGSQIFREIGAGGGNGGGSTAYEKVRSEAQELVKAGKAKTVEQGVQQVFKAKPELYREHRAEQKARN